MFVSKNPLKIIYVCGGFGSFIAKFEIISCFEGKKIVKI